VGVEPDRLAVIFILAPLRCLPEVSHITASILLASLNHPNPQTKPGVLVAYAPETAGKRHSQAHGRLSEIRQALSAVVANVEYTSVRF
jgi:hypothetical protein